MYCCLCGFTMHSRRHPRRSGLEDIRRYFDQPPAHYLGLEPAVCWILDCLLRSDSYPSALVQELNAQHPRLRLSETVLHQAIHFLEQQAALQSYSQRCPSRGRPRRMLHLVESYRQEARQLMPRWRHWLEENGDPSVARALWREAPVCAL